jgi:hypothetical protein
MKRNKLGASLILATILLATTAIGYFAYARYFAGTMLPGELLLSDRNREDFRFVDSWFH